MIDKIKHLLTSLILVGAVGLVVAPVTYAAPVDDACRGLTLADPTATCSQTGADDQFGKIVRRIINILSVIVGAVSVIMIIIGGFRYVISNGDTNGLQGAKNTVLYAIVGLVIVAFAQIIVRFVLTNAKNDPPAATNFKQQQIAIRN